MTLFLSLNAHCVRNSRGDYCRLSYAPSSASGTRELPPHRLALHVGTATTQVVYEREHGKLLAALDELEQRLAGSRFLLGDEPV
jgi:Glutathione S-transferase, C-terminal domain